MKRKVSIGFSKPKKFKIGSFLIRLWQGGTSYSHVYLKHTWKSIDRTIVIQAGHGDVHIIEYSNFLEDQFVCAEFEVEVDDGHYLEAMRTAVDLLQRPYGYVGLLVLLLAKLLKIKNGGDNKRTLHCSELVAYSFPELLPYLGNKDPDFIEPVDIYNALVKCPFASIT